MRVPRGALVLAALLRHAQPGLVPALEIRDERGTLLAALKNVEQLQLRHKCPHLGYGGGD